MQNHNDDAIIKTSDTFLRKIYLSLYLKGLCVRGSWPPHLWPSVLCLSCSPGLLNWRPRGPALYWMLFSLPHLVTKLSNLQTNWLPVFTELYNSSIALSISLEWHVWSSSRNNFHAVHKSLSSGASVYDCTMGFYLVPYCQPSPPTSFLPITAIGMCHFHYLWNGMFGRVEGQYTTHIHIELFSVISRWHFIHFALLHPLIPIWLRNWYRVPASCFYFYSFHDHVIPFLFQVFFKIFIFAGFILMALLHPAIIWFW